MIKKALLIFFTVAIAINSVSCANITSVINPSEKSNSYTRYQSDFVGSFDIHTTFLAYTQTKEEFNLYFEIIRNKMDELNKLFDIYNYYEGVNNLKVINDYAGIAPVETDSQIIDLLLKSKLAYEYTNGTVNVTMGPPLRLWHDARAAAGDNSETAYVPSMEALQEAAKNTDINDVVIDEQRGTVFLKNKGMMLDVGAVAKGYAVKSAIGEAVEAGLESGILNAGGNVSAVGKPMDDRARWGIGIRDPFLDPEGTTTTLDAIFVNTAAIVTSGNYERFYTVDGKNYNHIIDPDTLMPAERYAGVTIMHPDSFIADMLSTALFIMPKEDGEALLKQWDAQAIWVFQNGTTEATDGYKAISKTFGNYSSID